MMLSPGRLLVAKASLKSDPITAAAPACSILGSITGDLRWPTTILSRCFAQSASSGNDGSDISAGGPATSAPTSEKTPKLPTPTQGDAGAPITPATPLQAPAASPEAKALAEKLRESSPTGRLLDLFAPQGREVGRPRPSQVPGADAAASAAAVAIPTDADMVAVVMRAVENVKPLMAVRQIKSGNRVSYMPRPLDPGQSTRFAVKWLVQAAEKRQQASRGKGKRQVKIADCLATELLLAFQCKGAARTKRDDLHKVALDNRANLRGKWW